MSQWPKFDSSTGRRVKNILRSRAFGADRCVPDFEREFCTWSGAKDAIAVANGTCALELAFRSLGIGEGDEVICTPYSFIASSFAIMLAGAQPVFCDVGMDHMIDIESARGLVTRRTKAILVVHLFGVVAEMRPILAFARSHRLKVVEDCAQALGGEYGGRKVGTIGDVGCYSFCQSKHITCGGEGGMVTVRNGALGAKVRELRAALDYTMTEICAAVGLAGFHRLESWNLKRRRMLAKTLIGGLKNHPLIKAMPVDTPMRANAFWLVPFVMDTSRLKCSGLDFILAVQRAGAGAYAVLWPEMYREEAFTKRHGLGVRNLPFGGNGARKINYGAVKCPVAHSLTESVIGFWVHPTRTINEIRSDINAFKNAYGQLKVKNDKIVGKAIKVKSER